MKARVLMSIVVVMILASAVQAGITGTQYVIGIGTNNNAAGSQNTKTAAVNNDTKWSQLSGMGTATLTGTNLSKGLDADGDGNVDAYMVFDFSITNTSTKLDDFFATYGDDGTTKHYHRRWTLGTTQKNNTTAEAADKPKLQSSDVLNFTFSNVHISDTLGGIEVSSNYGFSTIKFADAMAISTNISSTTNKFDLSFEGLSKLSGDTDLAIGHRRLSLNKNLTETGIDTGIFGGSGTWARNVGGNFMLTNLRLDAAIVPIPEPATLAMLGTGALLAFRRRRKA